MDDLVWYVSYGSNLCSARFDCYLSGGRPPGAARTYPGCRDTSPARANAALWLPGGIYFAWDSPVWGGGIAFYDADLPGKVAARGYLITAGQFADIAAQEMYREPSAPLDLSTVLSSGKHAVGPGRYETLLCAGYRDGHPLLTFTAPWTAASAEHTRPTPAYLRMLIAGLIESHGWTRYEAMDYLAERTRLRS